MEIALSLLVLTIFALVAGALVLTRRGGYGRQAVLMLVLAGVIAINLAFWVVPTREGKSLAGATHQLPE